MCCLGFFFGSSCSSTLRRRPVEVPVAGLDQPATWEYAVRKVEIVQRRERATWGDSEDRAMVEGPTLEEYPVEVPIGTLNQRPDIFAAAAVQRREPRRLGSP